MLPQTEATRRSTAIAVTSASAGAEVAIADDGAGVGAVMAAGGAVAGVVAVVVVAVGAWRGAETVVAVGTVAAAGLLAAGLLAAGLLVVAVGELPPTSLGDAARSCAMIPTVDKTKVSEPQRCIVRDIVMDIGACHRWQDCLSC